VRVAVLGAGGPAGANTCRALKKAGHEVIAFDQVMSHLRFVGDDVGKAKAGNLTPSVVNGLEADVVLACPDSLVLWLSEHRDEVEAATFLPRRNVIGVCQDKMLTASEWHNCGLGGGAVVFGPELPDYLKIAEERFGLPFWLRATRGAGARGAILVENLRSAYHWMRFWEVSGHDIEWMAQEYLPGRDVAWTGVYFHGQLVTSFARERLEYIYPHLTPSGLTGTPTIARVVHDEFVNAVAEDAVAAVDDMPHGIMSVDLRENLFGLLVPTEINAGRGFTTLGLWSLHSLNFLHLAVQCALADGATISHPGVIRGDGMHPITRDALPEGLTLYRHLDCGHRFVLEPRTLGANIVDEHAGALRKLAQS